MNAHSKEIEEFVMRVSKRGGYCNYFELFELLNLWMLVFDDTEKYRRFSSQRQLQKMWRDLKKLYENERRPKKKPGRKKKLCG